MLTGEAIQQNTNLVVTTCTSLDQIEDTNCDKFKSIFEEAQVS